MKANTDTDDQMDERDEYIYQLEKNLMWRDKAIVEGGELLQKVRNDILKVQRMANAIENN